MLPRRLLGATALAACLTACQGNDGPTAGRLPAAAQSLPITSLLRLPRAGGSPRLYAGPALGESPWRARGRLQPLQRPIGFDLDQGVAFAVDSNGGLLALDLTTGTSRTILKGLRAVTLGPEGTLYAVDAKGALTRIRHRLPEASEITLPARLAALYGTVDHQLLAVETADSTRLSLLVAGQPPLSAATPKGEAAATYWGDLVAVATEEGLYLWDPRAAEPPRRIKVSGKPRTVRFSASGHRLFVGREDEGVAVVDRYTGNRLRDLDVPGSAASLRVAPYGGWLLARPSDGDTLWVVNLATGSFAGMLPARWGFDLPTVLGERTLLVREGGDVVARDLGREGFPETGRIRGGASDLYLPVPWAPAGTPPDTEPEAPPAEDQADVVAGDTFPVDEAPPEEEINYYLQVSRSQNPDWARALVDSLKLEGQPALVLDPLPGEDAYRVVVGPFASREGAEEAGRQLGRPSFIYQR